MIGYPWQSRNDIKKEIALLKKLPLDELRITFFTPFPGTTIYEKYRGILTTQDWSLFTSNAPIIKNKDITPKTFFLLRKEILIDFYNSEEYQNRVKQKIQKFAHLKEPFEDFFIFLNKFGILKRKYK